tara:strand:- start:211 stop:558 length:348 start_codon:yes stop_codon:yes gene_type:complete
VGDVAEPAGFALVLVARGADAGRWSAAVEAERTSAAVVVIARHVMVTDSVCQTGEAPDVIRQRLVAVVLQYAALLLFAMRNEIRRESAAAVPDTGASALQLLADVGAWQSVCGDE